ncbi:45515_t:CDS:2, partial [Gigaspora margarita]
MEEEYGIPGSSFSTVRVKSSTSTKIGDHKPIIDQPSTPLLELLVDSLLLLSDTSLFNVKCHTRNTIPRLELHLRTLVATLEIVFHSPTILTRETREKLYSDLDNFVDIHYRTTEMFNQDVNHSFKAKFKSKEINVTSNTYMHFPNYNINFLLIHLCDTLHCMRDDKTQLDEFFRRFKEGILALISAAPKISSVASGNIPGAIDDSLINNTLPRIINAFNVKYPITYWYPVWTYLLESLWLYAFNQGYEQQKHDDILTILNNQKAFRALWTRKEPTALPNSLWFDIVQEEIDKFIELLPVDAGLKIESLIHDVNQKLQLNNEFIKQVDINYNKKSIIKNNTPDETSNPLLEIIAENFTCKITGQITGDFIILSCCGNLIRHDAI